MSEFITIQVGQCGNQIGSTLWPHILKEYNISLSESKTRIQGNLQSNKQKSLTSFFHVHVNAKKPSNHGSLYELSNSKIKARAVCIDMEDSVVARYRTGCLKGLFDERCLVTNYPGSGNNWAEGFCEHGPQYQEKILQSLRYVIEKCDSLHGFLMLFSTGGGTGSGLGTYVLKLLSDFYPKIERFVSCVYSTGTEDVITCPYNNALATQQLLENGTCVFPIENRCLVDIVSRKYRNNFTNKTDYPSMFSPFEDMNSIVVEMLLHLTRAGNLERKQDESVIGKSHIIQDIYICKQYVHGWGKTRGKKRISGIMHLIFRPSKNFYKESPFFKSFTFCGSRFSGSLNFDMNEINTNMVPYPQMNFLSSGFNHSTGNNVKSYQTSKQLKEEMFLASCNRSNQLIKLDPLGPKSLLLASTLIGRGDYTLTDLQSYTEKLQSKAKFTLWSKKSIKVGLCSVPPTNQNIGLFSLFNTTGMSGLFEHVYNQYNRLLKKEAHMHHYTKIDNFDEEFFVECTESLQNIMDKYAELETMAPVKIPRLRPLEVS